jgi:hypothetical protein
VNLAVSLHAPDQDIRCQIMPAARAFPLVKLMNALQSYQNERWDYNNASLTSVKTLAWRFDFWLHFHVSSQQADHLYWVHYAWWS